jgi:uncharacterized protein involved in outer membrane biogenesis
MELNVDARRPEPALSLSVHADEVNVGRLTRHFERGSQAEGILDASITLESHGHSSAEIRANLDGVFGAALRDGVIASEFGDMFVTNVMKLSLPALLSPGQTGFGCIVIEFDVAEGVAAAQTLVVDSKNVVVVGSGEIDLGADAYDLVLSPRARKPGVLNLAAEVTVTGPIAKPKFSARTSTIPGQVARGLLANLLAPMNVALKPLRKKAKRLCEEGFTPPTRSAE